MRLDERSSKPKTNQVESGSSRNTGAPGQDAFFKAGHLLDYLRPRACIQRPERP